MWVYLGGSSAKRESKRAGESAALLYELVQRGSTVTMCFRVWVGFCLILGIFQRGQHVNGQWKAAVGLLKNVDYFQAVFMCDW